MMARPVCEKSQPGSVPLDRVSGAADGLSDLKMDSHKQTKTKASEPMKMVKDGTVRSIQAPTF